MKSVRLLMFGPLRDVVGTDKLEFETDLRSVMRPRGKDEQIAWLIAEAVWKKEEGHLIDRPGFVRPWRTMSGIGG